MRTIKYLEKLLNAICDVEEQHHAKVTMYEIEDTCNMYYFVLNNGYYIAYDRTTETHSIILKGVITE